MPEPTTLADALVRIEQLERELARYQKKGKAKTLCPDTLPSGDLLVWASINGFSSQQLDAAFLRVHGWSHADHNRRVNWAQVIKNAMKDGWALKGAPPPTIDSSPKTRQWESEAEIRRREQDECIDQWVNKQREVYFGFHPDEKRRYLERHQTDSKARRTPSAATSRQTGTSVHEGPLGRR